MASEQSSEDLLCEAKRLLADLQGKEWDDDNPDDVREKKRRMVEIKLILDQDSEATRRLKEETHQIEEETRRLKEERRRREEDLRHTNLLEYLDACHTELHGTLIIPEVILSTQDGPSNPDTTKRPERVCEWMSFEEEQLKVLRDVLTSELADGHHFEPITGVRSIRRWLGDYRKIGSEQALRRFQDQAVEEPVAQIIRQISENESLREKFQIKGSVEIENHSETMETDSMSNAPEPKGQLNLPRGDQFCVYNTSTGDGKDRVAAFIIQQKAPYKLPLNYIYDGLEDLKDKNLEDVAFTRVEENAPDRLRRMIAAIITQAFSYMIKAGCEYGCVCTGLAYIFLRVGDDPRIVYYHLSVPEGDVGEKTGWSPGSDDSNRLHLTAASNMLAFTLRAMQTRLRPQSWRRRAAELLQDWGFDYEQLQSSVHKEKKPSSVYRPPANRGCIRESPLKSPKPQSKQADGHIINACHENDNEKSDGETLGRTRTKSPNRASIEDTTNCSNSDTSNNPPSNSGYCTQDCLWGLTENGLLDQSCPNVQQHQINAPGTTSHQITQSVFIDLVREQLAKDLDNNCSPISRSGAVGVLFRVRLEAFGYTVVAKACPSWFAYRLKLEEARYEHLRELQGTHIPVHLGNIDLEVPYMYEGICDLTHMMLMSYGGVGIWDALTLENHQDLAEAFKYTAKHIHRLGILHNDLVPRNMLLNEEYEQVMVADFERSKMVTPEPESDDENDSADAENMKLLERRQHAMSRFEKERNRIDYELGLPFSRRR